MVCMYGFSSKIFYGNMLVICGKFIAFVFFMSFWTVCNSDVHDIDAYLNVVNEGESAEKIQLYKYFYNYSGVADIRVFDAIEKNIRNSNLETLKVQSEYEVLHWGFKALASSGNDKYLEVLREYENSGKFRKTRRHAKKSRVRLSEFSRWNSVIAGKEYETKSRSKEEARWMRLLASGDFKMAKFAVVKAGKSSSYNDRQFVDAVAKRLMSIYMKETRDRDSLDFQVHACKYLGMDVEPAEHLPLLLVVAKKSPNENIKVWADKSLLM